MDNHNNTDEFLTHELLDYDERNSLSPEKREVIKNKLLFDSIMLKTAEISSNLFNIIKGSLHSFDPKQKATILELLKKDLFYKIESYIRELD